MLDDPGGRILIVEDNAVLLLGLEATLQEWGYETLAADSGETALDLAAKEGWRIDMIIADHRLGDGVDWRRDGRDNNMRGCEAIDLIEPLNAPF
jgi:CheY-like chemotaxis protein